MQSCWLKDCIFKKWKCVGKALGTRFSGSVAGGIFWDLGRARGEEAVRRVVVSSEWYTRCAACTEYRFPWWSPPEADRSVAHAKHAGGGGGVVEVGDVVRRSHRLRRKIVG